MADFELTIEQEKFQKHGVTALFNENLYGELLDEHASGLITPRLIVRPHMGWGLSPTRQFLLRRRHPFTYEVGSYEDGQLDIACQEDIYKTNNTLLHETKHLIDDESDEVPDVKTKLLQKVGSVTVATLAFDAGLSHLELSPVPLLTTLGVVTTANFLVSKRYAYLESRDEVSARTFASDPEVLEAFGYIVSYRSFE